MVQVATAYPLQKFGSRFANIGTINLYTLYNPNDDRQVKWIVRIIYIQKTIQHLEKNPYPSNIIGIIFRKKLYYIDISEDIR